MRFEDIEGTQGGSGASTGASIAAPAAVAGPPIAAAAKTGSSGASGASPGASGASGASGAAPSLTTLGTHGKRPADHALPCRNAPRRTIPNTTAPAHDLLTEINISCWTGLKFPIAIRADSIVQDLENKIIHVLASDPAYEELSRVAQSRGMQLVYNGKTLIHKFNKLDCYIVHIAGERSVGIVVHVFVGKGKGVTR